MAKYLLVFLSFPFIAFAEVLTWSCGETCEATLDDGGTFRVSGSGDMNNYRTLSVDSQPVPWKDYLEQIKNVVVEDGITRLGHYVFAYCPNLVTASLPNSLQSMGTGAFAWSGLQNIILPNSLKKIEAGAFRATELTDIVLPESVTYLGPHAFQDTNLESITISDSIIPYDEFLFTGNSQLKKIYCNGNLQKCKENMAAALAHMDLTDKVKWGYPIKRIYTVEEAEKVSKKTGNTFRLRYK